MELRGLFARLRGTHKRPKKLGHADHDFRARRDTVRLVVQPDVLLEVCWKDLAAGRGPAASLFVLGDEVLRFDCFGRDLGHYHAELVQPERAERRLYFPEATVEEQVERALFELTRNLDYYLQRNPRREIRHLAVDRAGLEKACAEARVRLLGYLDTVEILASLRSPSA